MNITLVIEVAPDERNAPTADKDLALHVANALAERVGNVVGAFWCDDNRYEVGRIQALGDMITPAPAVELSAPEPATKPRKRAAKAAPAFSAKTN
jgi:hypothetical protein